MKRVELYAQVRRAVYVEGISQREAARRFGIDPRTVAKMLAFSVPPGYRRSQPPARPKLDPFVGIIDRILEEDKSQPAKQHHTAKRIFERLRDEHGYGGGISIVRGYVHERRERLREMFVPGVDPVSWSVFGRKGKEESDAENTSTISGRVSAADGRTGARRAVPEGVSA